MGVSEALPTYRFVAEAGQPSDVLAFFFAARKAKVRSAGSKNRGFRFGLLAPIKI